MNNKTIIIANHKTSIQLKNWMIQQLPQAQLLATIHNTQEGLMMLQQKQPQWAFVNLDDLTAEDFLQLKQMKHPAFSIVFVTPAMLERNIPFPKQVLNQTLEKTNYLKLKINGDTKSIPFDKIMRLEACSNYTQIYLSGLKKAVLTSKTLKFYTGQIGEDIFVKPHQSHLVNRHFIEKVVLKPEPYLFLKDGTKIRIARRRLKIFKI